MKVLLNKLRYMRVRPDLRFEVYRHGPRFYYMLRESSYCKDLVQVRPGDEGPVEICKDLPHGSTVMDPWGHVWTVTHCPLGTRLCSVLEVPGELPRIEYRHMYSDQESFTEHELKYNETIWGNAKNPTLQDVHDSADFLDERVVVISVGPVCLINEMQSRQ